jgi:hypothetical protein
MVRVAFLLATLLAVTSAVDTVPVREGGMLRGPVDDTKGRRQLWGGWYTLMSKSLSFLFMGVFNLETISPLTPSQITFAHRTRNTAPVNGTTRITPTTARAVLAVKAVLLRTGAQKVETRAISHTMLTKMEMW